jgi:hypothetical protein
VARQILDSGVAAPKTASWLRTKRRHDALAGWLARPGPRRRILGGLARLAARPALRRPLANWFLRP